MGYIVEAFTDGACKGNPGPGGWGVFLRYGSHEKKLFGGEPDTTNNRMELMAAIQALEALKRPSQVRLVTDSEYLRQGITTWIHQWLKTNWRGGRVKNQDLWQKLYKLTQIHQVQWEWVKGHAGHRENEIADALANEGIKQIIN